ncbi:MAG: heavy metal-responsive transcriptional regulator [Sphingobium sp.]|nr:heavy metal-responsive transcriptional regulator [Sphingobium sp.]
MTIRYEPSSPRYFAIGVLARQAGVAVDTIRYYEREGLLSSPHRKASGYRQYDAKAVEQVRFIRRAKDLGFTLGEIKELLALENDRENGVQGVKARAHERIRELDFRIAEMTRMRDALTHLAEACPGHGDPGCCPILSALHGEEGKEQASHLETSSSSCCGGSHMKS